MNKHKAAIAKNFSRYASFYDGYADVQRRAALELAETIGRDGFGRILEVGCGTGNFTSLLRTRHRAASVIAVDISQEMIAVARRKVMSGNVSFLVADAEEMGLASKFDCITSNACFQWFARLKKTLAVYARMLKPGGLIAFSVFGPRTYHELGMALSDVFPGMAIEAGRFAEKEELFNLLPPFFKNVKIREVVYGERCANLGELLKKIKYTGTSGAGLEGATRLGRGALGNIEEAYVRRFGVIRATHQVFFCRGEKP